MQYHHKIKPNMQGTTFALSDLAVNYVVSKVFDSEFKGKLTVELGIAKTHPKDRYNKKIGRAVADKNVKLVELDVLGFGINSMGVVSLYAAYGDNDFLFEGDTGKPNLHLKMVG